MATCHYTRTKYVPKSDSVDLDYWQLVESEILYSAGKFGYRFICNF